MKLYLISQDEENGCDTYDSAVVAAESEEIARNIDPSKDGQLITEAEWNKFYGSWCNKPELVTVRYLGEAVEGTEQSVICASFNAG